jgi:hypothetical protein
MNANPNIAKLLTFKLSAAKGIGFTAKDEWIMGSPSAQTPVGYNRANEPMRDPVLAQDPIGFKPIEKAVRFQTQQELNRVVKYLNLDSLDEILEFRARLAQTDFNELEYNAEAVRKRNPRFFQAIKRESKAQAQKLGLILQTEWTVGFKHEVRLNTPIIADEIGFNASMDCRKAMEGLL